MDEAVDGGERTRQSRKKLIDARIASSEMLPDGDLLPHLICSPPVFRGGGGDEAGQHGDA